MSLSHENLKQRLRDVIITAVRHRHYGVVEKAVEENKKFEEKYNRFPPTTGDLLDFCDMPHDLPKEMHYSPLMYACESSDLKMVESLLTKNASVAFCNQGGLNALHVACLKGNSDIVEALLQYSERQDKFCQRKGLPSDLHIALNARTEEDGWCPLFYAARKGHVSIVKCLLEKELASIPQDYIYPIPISIRITSKEAWNVLHHACAGGNVEVLKWLFENIPEVKTAEFLNARTNRGYTSLLIACQYQKTDIVKYFGGIPEVDFCVSVLGTDEEDGMTGLHLAATHDSAEIARLLIDNKCPVDAQNRRDRETALHIAVREASLDVENILRKSPWGKELGQIRNKDGQIPSEIEVHAVIPAEIKKRGEHAVELYRKALREGKMKIPRCNLLVLGEECAGKTSLIRLLTGKGFERNLERTHGIDDHVVDTRAISTLTWKEVEQQNQERENDDLFVTGLVKEMGPLEPLNQQKQRKEKTEEVVSKDMLLSDIDEIFSVMEHVQKPSSPAASRSHQDAPVQQQAHNQALHSTKQPTMPKEDRPVINAGEPKPNNATEPSPESQETEVDIETQETSRQEGIKLNHKQIQLINKRLKSQDKKEPTLHLKTYDFAGQDVYRPMHHCFITRRSLYLVVFNLQKLVASKQEGRKSLEKIRYWLNSIHAHIYTEPNDNEMKQVFLVGTHKSPKNSKDGRQITEDELKEIDELLVKTFYNDDRYVNHFQFLDKRIFAAIENSCDGQDERETSGAEALQQALTQTSKDLKFLEEEYPLLWLRFEAKLIQMREEEKTSQVVELSDVIKCAQQCGIMDLEQIYLALIFFHDTGTIIWLGRLPTLFLGKMEKGPLANLVLLDPKWLIKLMTIIMELERGATGFSGEEVRDLTQRGIAKAKFLRKCWRKELSLDAGGNILFRQVCLVLQAYCLIYPIRSSTDTTADEYLVPCKLPPKKIERKDLPWVTFYFDFRGFLPMEIFNHFVCLMLARSQDNESTKNPEFSATCCRFYNVEGCNWQLEVETDHNLLKVSLVFPKTEEKPLGSYISMIHNEFLQKICNEPENGLKGLRYHGGPWVDCCKSVLPCVKYLDNSNSDYSADVYCEEHRNKYDAEELLRCQVQKEKVNCQQGIPMKPQLKDLVLLVQTTKWFNLGLQLGIKDTELDVIEENNPKDIDTCKRKMFKAWLRITPSPSYQQLVEALVAVGEISEADRLCKKYGIQLQHF